MTESVNSAGQTSGNWFKQASAKTTKALKGFLHFGSVSKVSGNSHIKKASLGNSKPESTPLHSRSIRQTNTSELASIRTPVTSQSSPTTKTPTHPLLESDSVQEQIYNAEFQLMELNQNWSILNDAVSRTTALKEKTGRQFNKLSRQAGLRRQTALRSAKFASARNRFFKAVQLERTAKTALKNLETRIEKQENAIQRLRVAENIQAERELKQLQAGG
ncbi:hypothetical protein [Endozoicomonas lisbonensis]|uniref:Uncharacterized protein n=1 Tax=Endozoicomonas lisbonensis TaxID=3120522 RepID=A0ABV2SLR2_9GAMM